jgi:hypothetical protein
VLLAFADSAGSVSTKLAQPRSVGVVGLHSFIVSTVMLRDRRILATPFRSLRLRQDGEPN